MALASLVIAAGTFACKGSGRGGVCLETERQRDREMENVCREREGVCFEMETVGVCVAIERGCVER